ncbi:hypothetical protein BJV74DRAFT_888195 [Russula compacta]|nr:hypothetical protein BJV74DRAFT_888195 [Russula compacta]
MEKRKLGAANRDRDVHPPPNNPRRVEFCLRPRELGQIDLLIDGYISYTLTPLGAELYLDIFKKCLEKEPGVSVVEFDKGWVIVRSTTAQQRQQLHQQLRVTTTKPRPGYHYILRPPSPEARLALKLPLPLPLMNNNNKSRNEGPLPPLDHSYLLDCKVDLDLGTVVPQPTWIGVSVEQIVTGGSLLCPLFFVQRDGTLGVPFRDRARGREILRNATAFVPPLLRRSKKNMRIRIQWPGYKEFHYEFRIFDRRLEQLVPISLSRLVERVAGAIQHLYLDAERDPETFSERWKLAREGSDSESDEDGIRLDEIKIVGLLRISKGSWIPMIQLSRHVIPRCNTAQPIASSSGSSLSSSSSSSPPALPSPGAKRGRRQDEESCFYPPKKRQRLEKTILPRS